MGKLYSKLAIRATSICLLYFPYIFPKFQCKSVSLILIESIKNQEHLLCKNEGAQNSVIKYLVGNKVKKRVILKTSVPREQITPNFAKNEHFLPPDTHTFALLLAT